MRKFVYLLLILISAVLTVCSVFTVLKRRKNKQTDK